MLGAAEKEGHAWAPRAWLHPSPGPRLLILGFSTSCSSRITLRSGHAGQPPRSIGVGPGLHYHQPHTPENRMGSEV